MCMLGINGDYLGKAPSSGYAGYVLSIGDDGYPAWIPNIPQMRKGGFFARSSDGTGIEQYILKSGNSGANTEAVTTGKYPGSSSYDTGVVSVAGYAGRSYFNIGMQLGATAGTWYYETVFQIPTLSDAVDTFTLMMGFGDSGTVADQANGIYLRYTHGTNSGKFEFVTAAASTRTSTDTGVTAAAGTWYHALIVVTNNTTVSLYLVTDGSDLGSAVATNTTNIPTGSGQVFGLNSIILNSVGVLGRSLIVCYEQAWRVRAFTAVEATRWANPGRLTMGDGVGFATGDIGTALGFNRNAVLGWRNPCVPNDKNRYDAEELLGLGGEFTNVLGGTGTTLNSSVDNGFMTTVTYSTGTGSGDSAFRIAARLYIDANSGTVTYEAVFSIATLSTGAQTFTTRLGLLGATNGSADGVFLSIESNGDAQAQFITRAASSDTQTDSGLTIVAGTRYHLKIIVTNNTTVSCYLVAAGTALGSAVATHTTNIPSAYVTPGAGVVKSVGTTARTASLVLHRAYQMLAAIGTGPN